MNTWTESDHGVMGKPRDRRVEWAEPIRFVEYCLEAAMQRYDLNPGQRERFLLLKLEMATRRRRLMRAA